MLSLLARVFAPALFKTVWRKIRLAWDWTFSSTTRLLVAALVASVLFGLWERNQLTATREKLEECSLGRAADTKTWNERVVEAQAEAKRNQTKFVEASTDAQTYLEQLARADQSLRDYKSTHWVRIPVQNTLPNTAPGDGGDPAIHGEAPGAALLAITEADIDACDAAYTYAAGAFHLGQTLIKQGQAVLQTSGDIP